MAAGSGTVERSREWRVPAAAGGDAVLVVDPSPVLGEALARLLQRSGLAARHTSLAQARAEAVRWRPSVLLLNGDEQWREVLTCAAEVAAVAPDARVLLLVDTLGPWCDALAREAGAVGCVSRTRGADGLLGAIASSRSGRPLPAQDATKAAPRPRRSASPARKGPLAHLTPRENQVLLAMAGGLGDRTIAGEMGISTHTVRTHVQNILAKLGVHTRHQAVTLGLQAGLRPVASQSPGVRAARR